MKVIQSQLVIKVSLCAALGLAACDSSTSTDQDSTQNTSSSSSMNASAASSSSQQFAYDIDTLAVDYKGKHKVGYLDLSTGSVVYVDYDAWDVAINDETGEIISNSGIWGSGVRVYKTTSTDFAEDFSSQKSLVTGISDTTNNPFAGELDAKGKGSGTIYLVKDNAGGLFKVSFASYGPMGKYSLKIASGLDAVSATDVVGTISSGYGYTFIDLGTASDVSTKFPKLADWDLRFARALEFDMGGTFSARSAVLLNAKKGVQVAAVAGKNITEVKSAEGLQFNANPLSIGADWYTFDHDSKIYSVNATTYVLRTVEGSYGKLQIRSFYGPNKEQFWSIVKHGYAADGGTNFPE